MSFDLEKLRGVFRRNAEAPMSSSIISKPPDQHADAPSLGTLPRRSVLPDSDAAADVSDSGGLHEFVKNTDYWFEREVVQIEQYAREQALLHAQAGLPRQDAPASDELYLESQLRERAKELFGDWVSRVRRKIQDGIQRAADAAIAGVMQLRHALAQLDLTGHDIRTTKNDIEQCERDMADRQRSLQYERLLPTLAFWAAMVILTIVDWIANVPIFSLLLPHEPGSQAKLNDLFQDSMEAGHSGWHRLWIRINHAPEASLLALGVVVLLMVLCHSCGHNLRRIIAFKIEEEEPGISLDRRSHLRQSKRPFQIATVGITLLLIFLFFSRSALMRMADQHFKDASSQLEQLKGKIVEAHSNNDVAAAAALSGGPLSRMEAELEEANTSLQYAKGIVAMNFPILCLNAVLVLTAVTLAYLEASSQIVEGRIVDPRLSQLRSKLAAQQAEEITQRQALKGLIFTVQSSFAQARYLAESLPLRNWEAKQSRLNGIVPIFRSDNARHRGIDEQNIIAFRERRPIELQAINPDEPFVLPPDITIWEKEFESMRHWTGRLMGESQQAKGATA